MVSKETQGKLDTFAATVKESGVVGAVQFLNKRTPHRFTGIYRYDGATLRNVVLIDKYNPAQTSGDDVAMSDAYCALVREPGRNEELVFNDAHSDASIVAKDGPVLSYCGVLLRGADDEPYGTLCHYDIQRCEAPVHDLELLHAAAVMLSPASRRPRTGRSVRFWASRSPTRTSSARATSRRRP